MNAEWHNFATGEECARTLARDVTLLLQTAVSERGRASLVVSGGKGQGAHLAVSDSLGKVKGLLLLNPETVGLYLSPIDATGPPKSPRVVFEVLNQGTGGFAFYDKNGVTRALVGAVSDDGSSLMVVQDAAGKPAWKAP